MKDRSPEATPRTTALVECRAVLESIWIHGRLNEDLLRQMLAAIESANAALGPREVADDERPDYAPAREEALREAEAACRAIAKRHAERAAVLYGADVAKDCAARIANLRSGGADE